CVSLFFFSCHGAHRDLHSFPTRRSSDLCDTSRRHRRGSLGTTGRRCSASLVALLVLAQPDSALKPATISAWPASWRDGASQCCRSEEHTSELQSRFDLVCRLLLEKKKQY